MARVKTWYRVYLDNDGQVSHVATVKSLGLAVLTAQHYETIYPKEKRFRVWFE